MRVTHNSRADKLVALLISTYTSYIKKTINSEKKTIPVFKMTGKNCEILGNGEIN